MSSHQSEVYGQVVPPVMPEWRVWVPKLEVKLVYISDRLYAYKNREQIVQCLPMWNMLSDSDIETLVNSLKELK